MSNLGVTSLVQTFAIVGECAFNWLAVPTCTFVHKYGFNPIEQLTGIESSLSCETVLRFGIEMVVPIAILWAIGAFPSNRAVGAQNVANPQNLELPEFFDPEAPLEV